MIECLHMTDNSWYFKFKGEKRLLVTMFNLFRLGFHCKKGKYEKTTCANRFLCLILNVNL